MSLEPGMEDAYEFEVEGRLLTDVGGTLACEVLSTPAMVGMMERTASIRDDRKLRFSVEVIAADGRTIGVGTHERRVIDATPAA